MNTVTDTGLRFTPAWRWQAGLAALGPAYARPQLPAPLPAAHWVARSARVAAELGLSPDALAQPGWLDVLAGNNLFAGSDPLATVYSGHQFGHWAGQLGDGRALWLGETDAGLELQLKGAGPTPYSRMGDGRAVLRSSIREFLASEAMHGLGIPTTRALAIVGSELPVQRETVETAAVVTRVAPSFIRFGHFEHFAALGKVDALRRLADFVIERHYPACRAGTDAGGNTHAALLEAVAARTAQMIAHWQAVGFCHGVMNTDNMSILGLTLDYGPFQFLDGFDPGHICNHSDTQGRYAYARQPQIAYWNLRCLASALLPLIGEEAPAVSALQRYQTEFAAALPARYRAKLGLQARADEDDDLGLIDALLSLLAAERVDLTIFWRRLSRYVADGQAAPLGELFIDRPGLDAWLRRYDRRLAREDATQAAASMHGHNPKFVLRNHLAELAIRRAHEGDYSEIARLLTLLETPYDEHPGHEDAAGFAPDWAASLEISCSS